MARSVDDKVVRLEFENAQFEQRTAQSIATLQKLEQALKMQAGARGLNDIDAASKRLNFEGAAQGVQGLSAKFLALSTIAITALSTITSRAMDAGLRIVKSLSLEGVMSGFREYELNMNSIQTILSNTRAQGTSLTQVNAALDQLNTYADKTIYNFGQMTRNIGTFTAAGVKLDVALPSIKGIANLAAMSGSSAEQASTAMYQLSQAIASGSVKLMDWNSVVNAGMGGRVFQEALFESGKAMKTLQGVDMGTTFQQWTDSGHSFRESLQDGWITADVLTTTLGGMSGEMTEAALKAKGFSDTQIKSMLELGQAGLDAATKVRTFTGLVGTLKESVGSGWSQSFRTIIGNFDEATALWTGLSNTIGGFIGRNADVRNMTLLGAKQGGAMLLVIDGLRKAFNNLMGILRPIGQAFRDVFPRKTAQDLVDMSRSFNQFMDRLRPSANLMAGIRSAFSGFFSVLSIGWTIVKEVVKFIGELAKRLAGLVTQGGGAFNFVTKLGAGLLDLKKALVDNGGIARFFDTLLKGIDKVIPYIRDFISWIGRLFSGFKSESADKAAAGIERVGNRFAGLKRILGGLGDFLSPLFDSFDGLTERFERGFSKITGWFKQLGQRIADTIDAKDFDAVLDSVNTALLGGIALMIGKWLKGGLKVDVGDGLFGEIKKSFEALTGQLTLMQTQVKANIIEKIAIAVGILTASVVALSLVDPARLTSALTAMAVGFGQLLGAFAILDHIAGDARSAAKFAVIAAGLNMVASSMVILSGAVAILGSMDADTLAKGLGAITVLLVELTLISGPLAQDSLGMVAAGVGITALAVGLNILAGAVKLFSMMSWADLAKGFASVGAGLLIIGVAMNLMPATMPLTAAGLIGVAVAMNILAGAVKIFATMSWEDLGKGAAALAGGLVLIAAGMSLMPLTLPITAVGLILVANALVIMGGAMKLFATMDWGDIGRSLAVLAGAMLILALGLNAMQGAIAGAVALAIVTVTLAGLQRVLQAFADMGWGEILTGLGGLALTLLVLASVTSALSIFVPLMLLFGTALLVVGTALLLFGAGAFLAASAFSIFAKVGVAGAEALIAGFVAFGQALPEILTGVARGLIHFILEVAKGFPPLLKIIGEFTIMLLDLFVKLIPRLMVVLANLFMAILKLGYTFGPPLIALGFFLFTQLLLGIKNNIGKITETVIDIIVTFLNTLKANMNQLIDAGVGVLVALIQGIAQAVPQIVAAIDGVIIALLLAIAGHAQSMVDAGVQILVLFLFGLARDILLVAQAATTIITTLLDTIGSMTVQIMDAAFGVLLKFIAGLENNLQKVIDAGGDFVVSIIKGIGKQIGKIVTAAVDVIVAFIDGVSNNLGRIIESGKNLIIKFVRGVGDAGIEITNAAFDTIIKFVNGLTAAIDTRGGELRSAGVRLAGAIINGLTGGLAERAGEVAGSAIDVAKKAVQGAKGFLKVVGDPYSLVMMGVGDSMANGMRMGLNAGTRDVVGAAENVVAETLNAFSDLSQLASTLGDMDEFEPTITPVLDLSRVEADAALIAGYIQSSAKLSPTLSYAQARTIAAAAARPSDDTTPPPTPAQVNFEQTINAPRQLSTADIYKNTRNQIEFAKEELSIP